MRKAINFDIDTNKYEEYTGKKSPTAYAEIKRFMKKNGFEHRQGSGYISKESMNERKVTAIIIDMTSKFEWLKYCVKEIDATNIGKQHSLINVIENGSAETHISSIENMEI